jgi:hypothetical protein
MWMPIMTGALTDFQSQDVQEAARKGIGSELRRLFGLRSDVPHQMLALLVQLSDDPSGLKVGQLHSAIHRAFRNACQAMQIEVDADLAHADLILDKIIEVVRQGESDPEVICSVVLRELGERSRLTQERP